ncbi:MAG: septum formation initiator family protein [Candidatus Portnoybacteria bacterium]
MDQQSQPKKLIRKLLGSKVFLFCITLLLIILVINLFRESYRKYQLTKEIDKLESEIERLEGGNRQLAEMMEYFKDESYLEKEARLKLNLKKPDEKVIVLADQPEENTSAEDILEQAREGQKDKDETANYWKWWEYFFQY